jgi:hypothetical protein
MSLGEFIFPISERAGAVWKPTRFGNTPPHVHARAGDGLSCTIGVALSMAGRFSPRRRTGWIPRLAGLGLNLPVLASLSL